ncbi:MAG: tetratricopeptide repeat protein [Ignavibacteriales bacterium]
MKYKFAICLFLLSLIPAVSFAQNNDLYNRLRLGQSYEQAGDLQKAKSIYEDLYKQQPDNFQFFEALNRVYTLLKNYDASIIMIEKRLSMNPQDINMYGMLGSAYYLAGNEKKGNEIWEKAISIMPDKPMVYRVIANYAIERRAFEVAADILKKGKQTSRESFNFSYDLANLYSIMMKYKEAAEEYCEVLSADPAQVTLVETRISSYINKPDALKQTSEVVEKWAKQNDTNVNYYILLGWLYMENNAYSQAYDIYLKIDAMHSSTGAEIFNFAQRALQEGHFEEASRAFKKIFDTYPGSPFAPNAKIGYAKTLEASLDKKYNLANSRWKPFSADAPENTDGYRDAILAYSGLINDYRESETAYEAAYRIGVIKLDRLNDLNGAAVAFKEVIDHSIMSPFAVPALTRLAEIEVIKGNLQLASDYYGKIVENPRASDSDKNLASYMMAKIEFWNGNFSVANAMLSSIENNLSDNHTNDAIELSLIINTTKNDSLSLAQFAKAELLAFQRQYKPASEYYGKLSKNENLLTLRDLSALRYAEMTLALNELPVAIELLTAISNQSEKNIYADRAVYLLGQIYQYGIKDNAKAVESYENLLAKFPNSLYLDDARENINELKNKPSNNL